MRVSRVIVIHVLQPIAWNHRSRCGPSGFSPRYTRAKSSSAVATSSSRHSPPNLNSVKGRGPQFGHGTSSAMRPYRPFFRSRNTRCEAL